MEKQEYENLLSLIEQNPERLKEYKKSHEKDKHSSFVSFIDDYISSRGITRAYIIRQANLTNYGYRVLDGTKHTTNRDLILRICLAMRMNLDDIQKALRLYNMRLLDDSLFREEIIIAGIVTGKSVLDIDILLSKAGEEPLSV